MNNAARSLNDSPEVFRVARFASLVLLTLAVLAAAAACGDSDGDDDGSTHGEIGTETGDGEGDSESTESTPNEGHSQDTADLPVWGPDASDEATAVWNLCRQHDNADDCRAQDDIAILYNGQRVESCEWRELWSYAPDETCTSIYSVCELRSPEETCGGMITIRWLPIGDSGRFVIYGDTCFMYHPGMLRGSEAPRPDDVDPDEWPPEVEEACTE